MLIPDWDGPPKSFIGTHAGGLCPEERANGDAASGALPRGRGEGVAMGEVPLWPWVCIMGEGGAEGNEGGGGGGAEGNAASLGCGGGNEGVTPTACLRWTVCQSSQPYAPLPPLPPLCSQALQLLAQLRAEGDPKARAITRLRRIQQHQHQQHMLAAAGQQQGHRILSNINQVWREGGRDMWGVRSQVWKCKWSLRGAGASKSEAWNPDCSIYHTLRIELWIEPLLSGNRIATPSLNLPAPLPTVHISTLVLHTPADRLEQHDPAQAVRNVPEWTAGRR